MTDSARSYSPPDSYKHHVLETHESDIGLGIFKEDWPRQNILFRSTVNYSSAPVNFARPLGPVTRVEQRDGKIAYLESAQTLESSSIREFSRR